MDQSIGKNTKTLTEAPKHGPEHWQKCQNISWKHQNIDQHTKTSTKMLTQMPWPKHQNTDQSIHQNTTQFLWSCELLLWGFWREGLRGTIRSGEMFKALLRPQWGQTEGLMCPWNFTAGLISRALPASRLRISDKALAKAPKHWAKAASHWPKTSKHQSKHHTFVKMVPNIGRNTKPLHQLTHSNIAMKTWIWQNQQERFRETNLSFLLFYVIFSFTQVCVRMQCFGVCWLLIFFIRVVSGKPPRFHCHPNLPWFWSCVWELLAGQ